MQQYRYGMQWKASCAVCQDLGIFYINTPEVGAREQGAFDLCDCQKKITRCTGMAPYEYFDREKNAMVACPSKTARIALDRVRLLERNSGIPARYRGRFLDSIDIHQDIHRTDLAQAMDTATRLIGSLQQIKHKRGLYIYGPTGCGKTHLSCALINEILRMYQIPVRYAKISRDILGKLKASFNPNSEIYGEGKQIEEQLATIDVLVIDDFGVHRETEWVSQVLYDLIDARYENDLLTILTSNEAIDSWKDISNGRVLSRLREMCLEVQIDMPDYRKTVVSNINPF